MEAFWRLTPAETLAALDAYAQREEHEQQRLAWLAWHIAALQRTKRLPSLERLLRGHKTVQLRGDALEQKRREHAEMIERLSRGQNRTR